MRKTALAVAVVDLAAVVSLLVFFAVGGPFGTANDVLNAAVGVLSVLLAWRHRSAAGHERAGLPALTAACLGGVVMMVGSVLVISEATGWYLAGLVSALGAAGIGAWLVATNRAGSATGQLSGASGASSPTVPGSPRLGRAAGAVMLLGVLGVPAILSGVDDQALSPWYVVVAQLGWLGTYVLYPAWCLRFAAGFRAAARGRGAMLSPT